ncbi:MAG: bifunctional phosphopantothenoylcysteine decarboxylase/phosphopantothenate--cysteine ligase CoaBC [Bacteroidia bacterium]|nr:bifunctional phosphopantothenoylcysteine decarboxylase/phosphopantothenate--cysteine ligase CoaBC [Bacteroidia bacterium]
MLAGKRVVLGVTGSIAAYKSVFLVRLLQQAGAVVRVVMTSAAAKFIAPLTFRTLTREPVMVDLWDDQFSWSHHVQLGLWAEVVLIAPCTVNTIAKITTGLCEDAVSAVCYTTQAPVVIAPAMDREMHNHPKTQANLAELTQRGCTIIDAETGYLASGLEGAGRMAEPEDIIEQLEQILADHKLTAKKILITAGPTQESLDPVRFISNHSSGKMGFALARAARNLGAAVTLVSGPVTLKIPKNINHQQVTTAQEMFETVTTQQNQYDIIIMCAAVADYRPETTATQKVKKNQDEWTIRLIKNPDILLHLGQHKPANQKLIGFALETTDEIKHAHEKMIRKNLNMIVLNSLNTPNAGFGYDTNAVTLLFPSNISKSFSVDSKQKLAYEILLEITNLD